MSARYTFFRPDSGGAAFSPTAGVANWILECIAGEVTASATAMRTRIARDSAIGTGARTAIASDKRQPASAAVPGFGFISSVYATTVPTISNASLFATPWLSAGGQTIVSYEAAPGDGFILAGATSLECRQDIGTDPSGYGGAWEED
jgi:hypothetical protein